MQGAVHRLTAQEQWNEVRRGRVTARDLAAHHLDRIAEFDGGIGAFARVDADRALAAADAIDAAGQGALPLSGVPIAEKELASRAGTVPAWTRLFTAPAPESDPVIRAIDATGAVSLGATTAPEFGLVGFTEPLGRPAVRNPWDPARSAGGSSGGAAAAVAAGLVPFAVGSDGGGSIRIPAASCGVVGLKPSRGRVPAQGGQGALAGMVTSGPIARTVTDVAMLLDAITGRFPYATRPPEDGPFLPAAVRAEGRFQLGVLTDCVWDGATDIRVDDPCRQAVAAAVDALSQAGHGIDEVSLPGRDYPDVLRVLWIAGAAGIPAHGETELALLEPYTRALVERGRRVPVAQLLETLAAAASFERRAIATFAPFDAVLAPALALVPPPLGWYGSDPDPDVVFDKQVRASPFTSFVNVAGLPALVVPTAVVDSLPFGVQLIGRPGGEATLLALGRQLEWRLGTTAWHPPVFEA